MAATGLEARFSIVLVQQQPTPLQPVDESIEALTVLTIEGAGQNGIADILAIATG